MLRSDRFLAYALILPVVAAVVAFVVGPTYNVATLSLTKVVMGMERGFGTLGNFEALAADPVFGLVLKNTAIWILGGTFLCVAVGLGVGTFLAIDSRMTGWLRALILLPWVLPDVVTAMAWKWMLHGQVGIIGQTLQSSGLTEGTVSFLGDPNLVMWVLVVVLIWRKMPLVALILCAAIRAVPDDQVEAARMDGANAIQRFRFVTLPNIAFSLTAVTVISMIWITAEFALPWIMTGGGPANASQIMATYIYQQSFEFFNWGVASAMSVINLVMLASIVALYLYVNRRSWASEGSK
ncbi:carbohydrate ABC transporter permease [Mameliella sediminis]|uniref:carbohydrate ABC transporter permease n=1 Tax=Mameliella sediminis TaxID=2836866 RepID=UPI001C43BEED|nr:sugar ABC transporter permease [Mameliella sediminis]MBV7396859.1 sugar ABC transporter permease [Mameliella sediminis]MBY6116183.1 sugar ABC transporter permease [Antarctobacter heliothermus]MBY6146148.1 sugar ABC transporter permease [Mameliella alba]MCA0955333.1 sugar ABC transporter permease [Mameliella alba]